MDKDFSLENPSILLQSKTPKNNIDSTLPQHIALLSLAKPLNLIERKCPRFTKHNNRAHFINEID